MNEREIKMVGCNGLNAKKKRNHKNYNPSRKDRLRQHFLYGFVLFLVIITLFPSETVAQQEHLNASEAIDAVNSSERLEPSLLRAQPREANLYYEIDDREGTLSPMYWLVVMENQDGEAEGLVGIDAQSGDFVSETFVGHNYQSPRMDDARVRKDLSRAVDIEAYNLEGTKLVFIGGAKIAEGNYWLIPHQSGEVGRHLVFPAFQNATARIHASLENVGISPLTISESGRPYYEIGNGLLQQDQTGLSTDNSDNTGTSRIEQGSGPMPSKIQDRNYRNISSRNSELDSTAFSSQKYSRNITSSATKVHLDDIPLYYQGNTWGCGMFSLAMVHQWWSPVDLGNPFEQVWEIALYKGRATANVGPHAPSLSPSSVNDLPAPNWWGTFGPQYPQNVTDVMQNWDQVNSNYQDFQTVQSNNSQSLSDIKFWINRDTPVLAFVNSDNASVGFLDHWVVVTGYDDSINKLHLNNSGAQVGQSVASRGTVDYDRFENSYWTGIPTSRYLVVGYPGDRDRSAVSLDAQGISGAMTDTEFQSLEVSMSVEDDATAFGEDSFGDGKDHYHTGINIEFTQGEGLFGRIDNGAFDKHSLDPRNQIEFLRTSKVSQGTTIGRLSPASVSINPANRNPDISSLGTNTLEITAYAYDEDDRTHSSGEQIQVFDFDPNNNCDTDAPHSDLSDCYDRTSMPKPMFERVTQTHTETYQVEDDVSDAPEIVDVSPRDSSALGSSHAGLISLRPNFSTFMGGSSYCCDYKVISETVIHYRVLDSDGYIVVSEKTDTTNPGPNKGIAAVVSENEWQQGWKGGKIEWWVEATNTDNDRPGDRESMTSSKFLLKLDEKTANDDPGSPFDPEYSKYEKITKAKELEEAYMAAHAVGKFQHVLGQTDLNTCALSSDNCEDDSTFPLSESDLRESDYGGQPEACVTQLDNLFNILETSKTQTELNSGLDGFQKKGNITTARGPQCSSMGTMRTLSGNLEKGPQYKVSGRVLNEVTNRPLAGYGVHANDLGSQSGEGDIGLDVTNKKGEFAFTYSPIRGAGDTQKIQFTIMTQAGEEVATRSLDVQLDQTEPLELQVKPPESPKPDADVEIQNLPVELSENLANTLEELELNTLKDIRSAGGLSSIGNSEMNRSDWPANGVINIAVDIVRTLSAPSPQQAWESFAFVGANDISPAEESFKAPAEMGLRGFLTVLATSDTRQEIAPLVFDGASYGALLGTLHEIKRVTAETDQYQTTSPSSDNVSVSLVPRGGLSLPGVSSLGDVTGQAQSSLKGEKSVVTWGGSIEFGPRDDVANFRLTGLYRKGTVTSTLQNDQMTTTEIDEDFTAFTGDLILRPIPRILIQPYAIGGFGVRNVSYGRDEPATGEGWKPAAQLGVGVDLNIGTQGFFLGVELVDYISNFSNDGSLRHDAFLFGTVGIPLF